MCLGVPSGVTPTLVSGARWRGKEVALWVFPPPTRTQDPTSPPGPSDHFLTLAPALALSWGRPQELSLLALSAGPLGGVFYTSPGPGQVSQELWSWGTPEPWGKA